jgi:D-alanyl-D-alanine endopeptidase (penicillin-binding protein 7)
MACLFSGSSSADTPLSLASAGKQADSRVAENPWKSLNPKKLRLRSASALVVDETGRIVYAKQADEARPIASITKLMTAMVLLDSKLPMQEPITITKDDRDLLQLTGSRLKYGATLTRKQLLQLALMSSENRAANALARTYPGGKAAFVKAMNKKARALGMTNSRFADSAGLDAGNVASARDVMKMVRAAQAYPFIREASTTRSIGVHPYKGRGALRFGNTNRLLKNKTWDIQLSKTGYLNEAGRCLAMKAEIADQPLGIVLLNSFGKLTPFGDSNRIRKWIESGTDVAASDPETGLLKYSQLKPVQSRSIITASKQ